MGSNENHGVPGMVGGKKHRTLGNPKSEGRPAALARQRGERPKEARNPKSESIQAGGNICESVEVIEFPAAFEQFGLLQCKEKSRKDTFSAKMSFIFW